MRCLPPSDYAEQTGAELLLVAVVEDAAVPDPARATMASIQITQPDYAPLSRSVANALTVPETVLATGDGRDGDPAESPSRSHVTQICASRCRMVAANA